MSGTNVVSKKKLILLAGPTGIGKTETAIEVAENFHSEIISADSRQIYKELKIGSAAPNKIQLNRVKHHFVGILDIHEYYNASIYEEAVLGFLENYFKRNDVVILTGGSGLYIDAVLKGIDDLPTIDPSLRKELADKYKNEGIESIRNQLKILDPVYYKQVDLKNPNRILKGIEVTLMTGKPYSSFLTNSSKKRFFSIIKTGITAPREIIYNRINQRVDEMIKKGLVEEAQSLYHFKHANALNTVGYKELFTYFDGKSTLDEAIEEIKKNTRHYAKRQLTWFTRDKEIKWFSINEKNKLLDYLYRFY